jgi:hypothetical protein
MLINILIKTNKVWATVTTTVQHKDQMQKNLPRYTIPNYEKRKNIAPTLEHLYHNHIFRKGMKMKEVEMECQALEHNTTAQQMLVPMQYAYKPTQFTPQMVQYLPNPGYNPLQIG